MPAPTELLFTQGDPQQMAKFNAIVNALWDRGDIAVGGGIGEIQSGKSRTFYLLSQGINASTPPLAPLTILAATTSKDGTIHPGRVRVVNGLLGGLLPDEMTVGDAVLPDGTDNHCYLTMSQGTNYVYGKVLVDSDTGLFTSANIYIVASPEDPDDTYAYLPIGTVEYDGTTLSISQGTTGNQSLLVFTSADGSLLQPAWST